MKILLAVSGGIDSMYLANRALVSPEVLFAFPYGSRPEFAVAHCNFSLRGEESDGDEEFVRNWCGSNGIAIYTKRFDTAGYASENGISVEMAARQLRYEWFAELCREQGFDALAVAHNANDNAETLMLNLLRGTGIRGIRGMAGSGTNNGITVLRPMLGTSRNEIEAWMKANGKEWREDRTNSESEYKRNKLRNLVFPLFKEINPSFIKTLSEDMQRFRLAGDIAEEYIAEAGKQVKEGNYIDIRRLLALKHWKFVLWHLLEDCSFSTETFDKLTALLERYRNSPSGTVTLGGKTFQSPTHTLKAIKRKLVISERM